MTDEETIKLVAQYSNTIRKFGINSEKAKAIKEANKENKQFIKYAITLEWIKQTSQGNQMNEF